MPQDLQISILGLLWLVHLDGVGEVPWKWQRNWEFHSTYCVHTDLSPDTCICCCTLHVHSNQHKLFCGPPMGWNYLDFHVFYQAACCVSLQGPTSPNGTLTKPRLVAPSRKSLNTTSSSTVFSFQRFGPLMVLCVWAHVCMHVCVCMCLCVCICDLPPNSRGAVIPSFNPILMLLSLFNRDLILMSWNFEKGSVPRVVNPSLIHNNLQPSHSMAFSKVLLTAWP